MAYQNSNSYKSKNLKPNSLEDYVDFGYLPLIQENFEKVVFSGSTLTEKIFEDDTRISFKVSRFETNIEELYYLFTISKMSEKVVKYSYSGSVLHGKSWKEYSLLDIETLPSGNAEMVIKRDHLDIKSKFSYLKTKLYNSRSHTMTPDIQQLVRELPGYDLISVYGDISNFKDFKSDYYLICFCSMTTASSLKSMIVLNELSATYAKGSLRIMAITNFDRSIDGIRELLRENLISFEVYTSSAREGDKLRAMKRSPFFMIYDADFKIVSAFGGYNDKLKERLERMIAN